MNLPFKESLLCSIKQYLPKASHFILLLLGLSPPLPKMHIHHQNGMPLGLPLTPLVFNMQKWGYNIKIMEFRIKISLKPRDPFDIIT